jgi:hypothetical protein
MPDWKLHIRTRLASLHLSPTRENEIVEERAGSNVANLFLAPHPTLC